MNKGLDKVCITLIKNLGSAGVGVRVGVRAGVCVGERDGVLLGSGRNYDVFDFVFLLLFGVLKIVCCCSRV